jgi:hypothetical protein
MSITTNNAPVIRLRDFAREGKLGIGICSLRMLDLGRTDLR